jgi:hypothetical protein
LRATTDADTSWSRCTAASTSMMRSDRAFTTHPCSGVGPRKPSSAAKLTSTMASSGNGLSTSRWYVLSMVVVPSATYHDPDAVVEQGELDEPAGVTVVWATTAFVPYTSMSTPVNGAGARSRGTTTAWPRAATRRGVVTAAPSPGKNVRFPLIGVSVGLSTVMLPSPVERSARAGTPGQNHDVVSALPVRATGIGGWSLVPNAAATGVGRSREMATPTTAKTATTATSAMRRTSWLTVASPGARRRSVR